MVDLPRVRTPGQLQDGLDQLVLEWVEVPVRHALAAVAHVQRQQVARLDLVADPPAGFACHLGKRSDGKVVRRLEDIEQFHPLALNVRRHQRRGRSRGRNRRQPMCGGRNQRHGVTRLRHQQDWRSGNRRGRCACGLLIRERGHAFQMHGERHAGRLDLVLLEEVEPIGPVLHHAATLLHVLGMVVGRADLVGIDMRELCIHPDLRVADLVERSGHRAADAVSGQAFLIAHALEGTIERVLADALLQVAVVPEQVALGRLELIQQVPDDLHGLNRQRHDVGRDVLWLLPLLAHIQLELLHDVGRDDPQPTVQIELIRRRLSQLSGSHASQQQ